MKIESDLSNCGVEKATGVDILEFAKKAALARLKSDVDKLDIDELKAVSDKIKKFQLILNNSVTY